MLKEAGVGRFITNLFVANSKNGNAPIDKVVTVGSVLYGGFALTKMIREIMADSDRKNLILGLAEHDPVLSKVDKDQLIEWYASICHFAPHFALDRSAVREVLITFSRFGKVDVNTLKMLADTEKSTADATGRADTSWGKFITDAGDSMVGAGFGLGG